MFHTELCLAFLGYRCQFQSQIASSTDKLNSGIRRCEGSFLRALEKWRREVQIWSVADHGSDRKDISARELFQHFWKSHTSQNSGQIFFREGTKQCLQVQCSDFVHLFPAGSRHSCGCSRAWNNVTKSSSLHRNGMHQWIQFSNCTPQLRTLIFARHVLCWVLSWEPSSCFDGEKNAVECLLLREANYYESAKTFLSLAHFPKTTSSS